MLGALILQVMEKEDVESLKVMIFLIEGCLPSGYFNGSLGKKVHSGHAKMTSTIQRIRKYEFPLIQDLHIYMSYFSFIKYDIRTNRT